MKSKIVSIKKTKEKPSLGYKKIKKTLLILGGIILCLIIFILTFSFIAYKNIPELDDESHDFVNENIPHVLESWDENYLMSMADSDFKAATPDESIDKLFNLFDSKLGKFKSYEGSTGQASVLVTLTGKKITAHYIVRANFENAPAIIDINLVKNGNRWYILGFQVNSSAFLEEQQSK